MKYIEYIKEDGSKISVTPNPPSGQYSDTTIPNSNLDHRLMIRAAQVLRSSGENISVPQLTDTERTAAVTAQLGDKANWSEEETPSVLAEEIAKRKAELENQTDSFNEAVTVPDDATIEATLLSEKENQIAESKVNQLVSDGYLVTDLDADETYNDFKALLPITESAEA